MAIKPWPLTRRLAIAVTAFSGLVVGVSVLRASAPQAPPQASPAPTDAFVAADLDFRSIYAGGRAATLDKIDPLIVVELKPVSSFTAARRTEAKVIPRLYHRLKAVCTSRWPSTSAWHRMGTMAIEGDCLGKV